MVARALTRRSMLGGGTLLAAFGGAAFGAWVAHHFSRERDHLEIKRDVLRRVLGYRWQLTPGHAHPDGSFFTALNEIPVVFAGDKDVETALGKFHEATDEGFRAEHFVPLAQAMAKSAEVPHEGWDRDLIEHPFTPGPGSASK